MCSGKTCGSRQVIGPVLMPVNGGTITAETLKTPGTIDIGRFLERAHGQRHDRQAERQVAEDATLRLKNFPSITCGPSRNREDRHQAHDIASAAMKKVVAPEALSAAPSLRRSIEKKCLRESAVSVEHRHGSESSRSEQHGDP